MLAAGRGTRMRRPVGDSAADRSLTAEQRRAADRGLKGLIPIHGRPFLDHVLSALADGGVREVRLVVAPDSPIRPRYERTPTHRLSISFAEQPDPVGTADALLRAEPFAADSPFLVVNADNLYPPAAVEALRAIDGPGLAGFRRSTLVSGGIPAARVAAYAVLTRDDDGCLQRIVEKPNPAALAALTAVGAGSGDPWVSMTCWRFDRSIFDACRRVGRSPRGERELTDAVALDVRAGHRYRVVPVDSPVLDLSRRDDIPIVERRLRDRPVVL
ncbi:MAG: sugar phosphate nucleotidyltransferase [Gemmatimonadota bacterium]